MNNFAFLDISSSKETEKVSFFFKPLATCWR